MDQRKIGAFIATLRKEKGYTQRQLAELLGISEKTISKWECGNGLPEVVFLVPLCEILKISVNELLTGERIPILDMVRKMDETMTGLVKQLEIEQLKQRIYKLYRLEIKDVEISDLGAGSLTYFITCISGKYVVKYPSENGMSHMEEEPVLCDFLLKHGIPACKFVPNLYGQMISMDENGRRFHVQEFIQGQTFAYNQAPEWVMQKSAEMIGKIHIVLSDYPNLQEGIGEDFFKYRTIEGTLHSYENTLKRAIEKGDEQIANEIRSNMDILKRMPRYTFDVTKFTCKNTHGDYIISQILCGKEEINGVIDWTTACVHPVVWEIMRSYVYASPICVNGEIDIVDFTQYVQTYLQFATLNQYDLENMGNLFFFFTAVCNFYGQYYDAMTKNRIIFSQQASLSSKLLKWFDRHIDELTEALKSLQ